jgi:thioredoxin 1
MSITKISTEDDFAEAIKTSNTSYVLVDFYADWCGPCRRMGPLIKTIAEQHPHIKCLKVDIDEVPGLSDTYGVTSIPLFLMFKSGNLNPIDQVMGASQDKLAMMVGRTKSNS